MRSMNFTANGIYTIQNDIDETPIKFRVAHPDNLTVEEVIGIGVASAIGLLALLISSCVLHCKCRGKCCFKPKPNPHRGLTANDIDIEFK